MMLRMLEFFLKLNLANFLNFSFCNLPTYCLIHSMLISLTTYPLVLCNDTSSTVGVAAYKFKSK